MTTDTIGGVWTFTLDLSQALGAHDVEVVLAGLGGQPSESQLAEVARIPNLRLVTSDFKLEWMDDPWSDLETSTAWLLDLETRVAPDVIHLNSFGTGAAAWSAPVILTVHSCVKSWWRAVHGSPAPPSWDQYSRLVADAIHSARIVITPSHFMRRATEEECGPVPHSRVIPNARNSAGFAPKTKEPFVLSAGRLWDWAKNIGILSRIAGSLDWPIYVAGSMRHPDGGTQPLEGCRFLGQLDTATLAEWYARASIYALPARYEPFGLTALEAAMSGCALVLGDIPSLREIWQDAAVFLPPNDFAMWRSEILALSRDGTRRCALGLAARRRALEFTAERMAGEYFACYLEAIHQREAACGL